MGYYRQYVPNFASIAKPLFRLTAKGVPFEWSDEAADAFVKLRQALVELPILAYLDYSKKYIPDTDASAFEVGAILSQVQDGHERVTGYYSKTLSNVERNYCVTRRELLAVVQAVKHFRPYLYGREFLLRLCRKAEPSSQVARWLEVLSEFQYRMEHRPGRRHGNADGLSRVMSR